MEKMHIRGQLKAFYIFPLKPTNLTIIDHGFPHTKTKKLKFTKTNWSLKVAKTKAGSAGWFCGDSGGCSDEWKVEWLILGCLEGLVTDRRMNGQSSASYLTRNWQFSPDHLLSRGQQEEMGRKNQNCRESMFSKGWMARHNPFPVICVIIFENL